MIILKELVYENAKFCMPDGHPSFQKKKIDIHDHIYLYVGIRPSYAHRLSLAVAIQGKIGPQLLAVIHQGKGNKGNNHGCFKCG